MCTAGSLPYRGSPWQKPLGQRPPHWTEITLDRDHPWPDRSDIVQKPPLGQTNTSENITLPQTSFAGGNKKFFNFETAYQFELFFGYLTLISHGVNIHFNYNQYNYFSKIYIF